MGVGSGQMSGGETGKVDSQLIKEKKETKVLLGWNKAHGGGVWREIDIGQNLLLI